MSSRALRSLSFLLLASGWLDCEGRELPKPEIRQLVARIRRLPANALDPSQPAVPLERWLEETIPSLSPQEWDISDCDLKPNFAESSDVWPLCIVARVSPDPGGFGIRLHILVGTYGRGALCNPSVHSQSFMWQWCDQPAEKIPTRDLHTIRALSDIRAWIRERATEPCEVEEEAVARGYSLSLGATRSGTPSPPGIPLDDLLGDVRTMKRRLMREIGDETVLEGMSDAAFERMQALAEGVIISREEALIVEPDSRAFYALAQKYGRRTDVAFFWIFEQTYGGTAWPSYVQQLTDVTGCTDFASGKLVALYRWWWSFREKHPEDYVEEVRAQMSEIERRVGEDTCACDGRAGVIRELSAFAKAFPSSPAHVRVVKRLDAIAQGKADVRFNCASE